MSKRSKTNHVNDGDYTLYAAGAGTAITDMTSRPDNAMILQRLKNNDSGLTVLHLGDRPGNLFESANQYSPEAQSMGWLGYFLGKSMHLKALHLNYLGGVKPDELLTFFEGLNQNRSVQYLTIPLDCAAFQGLTQFFAENKNLIKIVVSPARDLGGGNAHWLSRALRSCISLKSFELRFDGIRPFYGIRREHNDECVVEIISSLSEKSELKEVALPRCLDRRSYRALADLLAWEGSQLQSLDITNSHMDVEDFEYLLNAIASNGKLQNLNMADCYSWGVDDEATLALIRDLVRAWGLIERPLLKEIVSNLVELDITTWTGVSTTDPDGSIDDEGVIAFSHALAGNRKLKVLRANWQRVTSRGWNAVSKLLCDTSSLNTTYTSNHTLQELGFHAEERDIIAANVMFQNQIVPLLAFNRNDDKSHVASAKILKTHDDFHMQVFFEWEFKMLPIAVHWLARAATSVLTNLLADPTIQRRKLSVIYEFGRNAPKSFVECHLRGELEEIRSREEKIEGEREMVPQERMPQELEWLKEHRRVIMNKLRGD